jgi:hypothetical protein
MNQVYTLKGGFIFRQLSNCFTQTDGHNEGRIHSVCRPCMNSGETLCNNTLYAIGTERHRTDVSQ